MATSDHAPPEEGGGKRKVQEFLGEHLGKLFHAFLAMLTALTHDELIELGFDTRSSTPCSEEGCKKTAELRGLCELHYVMAIYVVEAPAARGIIKARFSAEAMPDAAGPSGEEADVFTVPGISAQTLNRMIALYQMVKHENMLSDFVIDAQRRAEALGYQTNNSAGAFCANVRAFRNASNGELAMLERGHWRFTEKGCRNMEVRLSKKRT
jgi:hypothetical protein